jgi:hypothetical protein
MLERLGWCANNNKPKFMSKWHRAAIAGSDEVKLRGNERQCAGSAVSVLAHPCGYALSPNLCWPKRLGLLLLSKIQ